MSKKITKELQEAIFAMPEQEKDKLLLRLIAKDEMLIKKLHHQLVEDESATIEKRETLYEKISNSFEMSFFNGFDTPGILMMDMRDLNGEITRFVKITKDKIGEIVLTTHLVNVAFEKKLSMLLKKQKRADTFAEYVTKKADFVIKKLQKIHEDYYLELRDEVNKMLNFVHNYPPCAGYIKEMKLPKTIDE